MNRLNIFILLLLNLKVFAVYGQTMTQEEIAKLPKKEILNVIPDTNFITVLEDSVLIGQVISTCDGNSSHWGMSTIGVIKIKSSKSETIYSILTPDYKKYNYKVGTVVEISISPLTITDSYNKPGTITCVGIRGDKICIIKE